MRVGEAYAICKNINDCNRSDEDKGLAILMMLNMETHNGITKQELLKIIRYLHGLCFGVRIKIFGLIEI